MQTTAREILKDFYIATDDSPLDLTDSGALMGDHPAVPALECGGYAFVMGDDTGVNDDEDGDGYMFTTYGYVNGEDRWEPVDDSQFAADADEAREAVSAWFDGLPA